jgi:O-antigen/teichoic acid export membrane protein
MISYGVNFQIISITRMLFDPVTKGLMCKFGGLAMTGYYEMANRMIMQCRALLLSANQVLVPFVANLQETAQQQIQIVYKDSYRLFLYLALPFYSAIVAVSPIISELWLGRYETVFVSFFIILAFGWMLNSLNAPAYFVNLGIGRLRWNTLSHTVIGISNAALGLILGMIYGGMGVVAAFVISLAMGSAIIVTAYHVENNIPFKSLLPKESRLLTLASCFGILASLIVYYSLHETIDFFVASFLSCLIFVVIVIIPVWHHPLRLWILKWSPRCQIY